MFCNYIANMEMNPRVSPTKKTQKMVLFIFGIREKKPFDRSSAIQIRPWIDWVNPSLQKTACNPAQKNTNFSLGQFIKKRYGKNGD